MSNKPEPKQLQVPGTERKAIPELEEAAENFRLLRNERMQLTEKETAAQAELVAKMKAHNQTVYRYVDDKGNDQKVVLSEVSKAKVAKVRDRDSNESGGSDDN
jgi:hypothetical protein